ncbi:uncharacterized protein JN550_006016 [Neoarthrinium moseri]|uniref:uncharacterized protein n=1 Tax=Neoarthrinium moseri TaxID=1658444 RepID=UPI001FDB379C|nr:uncharacterized protein JN550_006016 [Neoarthrinium moseri]KAI1869029.1 hypothetical protein JN550_006016 [Neoarthrinium moseri]
MKSTLLFIGGLLGRATAQTFEDYEYLQFPANGMSCLYDPNPDPALETYTNFTTLEMEQLAYEFKDVEPYDPSAANVASGKCTWLAGVPFYWIGNNQLYSFTFAVDHTKNDIYFCGAIGQGVPVGSNWPAPCTYN